MTISVLAIIAHTMRAEAASGGAGVPGPPQVRGHLEAVGSPIDALTLLRSWDALS